MKKKTTNTTEKKDKEHASGYCENCRVKYTNFDEHIMTNRHRNFACDDRNFQDIDELIASLRKEKVWKCHLKRRLCIECFVLSNINLCHTLSQHYREYRLIRSSATSRQLLNILQMMHKDSK